MLNSLCHSTNSGSGTVEAMFCVNQMYVCGLQSLCTYLLGNTEGKGAEVTSGYQRLYCQLV